MAIVYGEAGALLMDLIVLKAKSILIELFNCAGRKGRDISLTHTASGQWLFRKRIPFIFLYTPASVLWVSYTVRAGVA